MSTPAKTLVYRKLDERGDMMMGAGDHQYLTNLDAMVQAIKTRLGLLYGEWWEMPEDGLPLWQQMLGQPRTDAQKRIIDLLLIERISDTRGVLSLEDIDSFYDGRTYTFSCTVKTIYGDTRLEWGVG